MTKWLTIVLLILAQSLSAQLTYDNLFVDYDSVVTYKNLRIIPIRRKGPPADLPALQHTISLSQALQQNLVQVQERGTTAIENVHWLSLYNNSDKNVLISSGELLAGGRQDRVVTKDTLVMARSGRIDLPVMCVEEGRWSEKDHKFLYQKMADMHLRKTIDIMRSQVQVWKEVDAQLEKVKIKNKTISYLARQRDKAYLRQQTDYQLFFEDRLAQPDSSVVGIACISGNKILGSDIFISSPLFYGKWQALLQGYIEEAIAFGETPSVSNAAMHAYLDQFLTDEASQELFVKKNGKQFKAGGKVIHLTTY